MIKKILLCFFLIPSLCFADAHTVLDYILEKNDKVFEAERKCIIAVHYLDIPDQISASKEKTEIIQNITSSVYESFSKIKFYSASLQEERTHKRHIEDLIRLQQQKIAIGPSMQEKMLELKIKLSDIDRKMIENSQKIEESKNSLLQFVDPLFHRQLLIIIEQNI